ncbi:uncharacterized protein BDR25DRAFT_359082 [Lindgomyces ingoldianus]|uniref:Uncharacterized protein n=1 Tax=Lindgomyces ingoldianus TaxID=673940 RepID=A0ACB6QKD0_9PLEO|nr:uncharacterized protein BDR25DRAFT_359082 [Lindgomyces ingoldianus]KAF2467033.1 hypothetical protein BDR25DRAFT_359082 [Lindgomyces ingoldianus]
MFDAASTWDRILKQKHPVHQTVCPEKQWTYEYSKDPTAADEASNACAEGDSRSTGEAAARDSSYGPVSHGVIDVVERRRSGQRLTRSMHVQTISSASWNCQSAPRPGASGLEQLNQSRPSEHAANLPNIAMGEARQEEAGETSPPPKTWKARRDSDLISPPHLPLPPSSSLLASHCITKTRSVSANSSCINAAPSNLKPTLPPAPPVETCSRR